MAKTRRDAVESQRRARAFLRTMHGTKTVPPSQQDVERLAREMRHYARDRAIEMLAALAEAIRQQNQEDM